MCECYEDLFLAPKGTLEVQMCKCLSVCSIHPWVILGPPGVISDDHSNLNQKHPTFSDAKICNSNSTTSTALQHHRIFKRNEKKPTLKISNFWRAYVVICPPLLCM